MSRNTEGWRAFVSRWYGADHVAFHDLHGAAERLPWPGGTLHQDVYDRPEPEAPVVVLLHGIQAYGRMFLSITEGLWQRGWAVVVPDIPGYGLSATRKDRGGGRSPTSLRAWRRRCAPPPPAGPSVRWCCPVPALGRRSPSRRR